MACRDQRSGSQLDGNSEHTEMNPEKEPTFERRIQTVVQIIIAALMLWMGNSAVETRQDIAVIKSQMIDMKLAVVQAQTAAATATAAAAAILAREIKEKR